MGRYINWDFVVHKYPGFSKLAAAENQGSNWIGQGESELDGWLGARYTVPFTAPIPMQVKDLSADIAYYKGLVLTNGKQGKLLWDYIEKRLTALRDGTMVLTTDSGTLLSSDGTAWSPDMNYHGAFSTLDPIEWRQDSNFLLDQANERM